MSSAATATPPLVTVTPSATAAKNRRTMEPTSKPHGKAFTPQDDLLIAKAFIATSEDPILGADRKSVTFFTSVLANYEVLHEEYNKCDGTSIANELESRDSPPSMKQHWHKINATCQKLHGIKAMNPMKSGENEKEYFCHILLIYKEHFGETSFAHIKAFEFLE